MIADLFTNDGKGNFSAFVSDLECNWPRVRGVCLQSGQRFGSLSEFMRKGRPVRDRDNDITHWEFNFNGTKVTVFND